MNNIYIYSVLSISTKNNKYERFCKYEYTTKKS